MNEAPTPPPAMTPEVRSAQRWNVVWVVPIVALLIGGWLIYRSFAAHGPMAQVRFETADGIAAGNTEVRCRSVKVGMVKSVKLADNLESVLVNLELNSDSSGLLRKGTQFWVVKPRLSATKLSGVGTLITGAYVELDPGDSRAKFKTRFEGLETPPATSRSVPGRRLTLTAEEAGSLAVGSTVFFRGFEVGRIEGRTLNKEALTVTYDAFVYEEYSSLVTENSKFWKTSGIDITADANGFKLRTSSIQEMISGGVAFGITDGGAPGEVAEDGRVFTLYRDEVTARNSTFNPTLKFLLLFDQTVRGLKEKAPVEFRGLTIGRVADISFDLGQSTDDSRIPVLIELDPTMMRPEVAREITKPDSVFLDEAVAKGLRASLKTGSLITGALFVDLDYYGEVAPAKLVKSGKYIIMPTVSAGFAQFEAKISAILEKMENLPINEAMVEITAAAAEVKTTMAESRSTLKEIEESAAAARATLEDPEFRELPADLRKTLAELQKSVVSVGPDGAVQGDLLRTLDELRAALRSLKALTTTIDEKPNSLIFGRESSGNPKPKAPRGRR